MVDTETANLLEKEAEDEIAKSLKRESFYLKIRTYIPSFILAGFWLVLGYLRTMGVQLGIFQVLNFFTGAVNGLTGNAIGGTVGKALLLICVNTFFREMILSDASTKEKLKMLWANLKKGILEMIPMYKEITSIIKLKKTSYILAALLGAAAGIAIYPFITSDGSFVNSMVLIMLAITLFRQLKQNKGLFMVVLHWILHFFKNADSSFADAIVTGISCGFTFAVLIAAVGEIPDAGYYIQRALTYGAPAILVIAGIATVVMSKKSSTKEEA